MHHTEGQPHLLSAVMPWKKPVSMQQRFDPNIGIAGAERQEEGPGSGKKRKVNRVRSQLRKQRITGVVGFIARRRGFSHDTARSSLTKQDLRDHTVDLAAPVLMGRACPRMVVLQVREPPLL